MIWKRIGIGFGVYLLASFVAAAIGPTPVSGLIAAAIGVTAALTYPWRKPEGR